MMRPTVRSVAMALIILLGIASAALSRTITVPDDFKSIGQAITAAKNGDTVVVKPGVYHERIKMKKGICLVSFAGRKGNERIRGPGRKRVLRRSLDTIIDGTGLKEPGYLLSFPKDTTAPMKVDGFTLRNLPRYHTGTKMFMVEIRGCSPVFVNNIIHGNRSWGGILSTGLGRGMGPPLETTARPLIKDNVIFDNLGPGISNGPNSEGIIRGNEIFDNHFTSRTNRGKVPPGIGIREYARPVIEENTCYRNGSGIGGINLDVNENPLVIRNNRLFENRRAGIRLKALPDRKGRLDAIIQGNTIYGNLDAGIMAINIHVMELISNKVYDNMASGLALFEPNRVLVESNEIYRNLDAGLRLVDATDVKVRKNRIYQNVTAGIHFAGWGKNRGRR